MLKMLREDVGLILRGGVGVIVLISQCRKYMTDLPEMESLAGAIGSIVKGDPKLRRRLVKERKAE
jgi:hypothetical protein